MKRTDDRGHQVELDHTQPDYLRGPDPDPLVYAGPNRRDKGGLTPGCISGCSWSTDGWFHHHPYCKGPGDQPQMERSFYLQIGNKGHEVRESEINSLLKQLRDKRHELGIVPAAPVPTPDERIFSLDGRSEAIIGSTEDGHLHIVQHWRRQDARVSVGAVILDGRQETALFQVLKDRQRQRDPKRSRQVAKITEQSKP